MATAAYRHLVIPGICMDQSWAIGSRRVSGTVLRCAAIDRKFRFY